MRTISRVAALAALVACAAVLAPVAYAAELAAQADARVVGADRALGARFAATVADPDLAVVDIQLADGYRVHTEANGVTGEVVLRTTTAAHGAERVVGLPEESLARLRALAGSFRAPELRAGTALARTLSLASVMPAGVPFDVRATRSIVPLCSKARAVGRWTVGGKSYREESGIGCYDEATHCAGRCGVGCGGTKGVDDPTVQRITQDCLNHDLCVDATGQTFGPCADEFRAAIDDFLLAPDCASLDGRWADNRRDLFALTQDRYAVDGSVSTSDCGRLDVSGTHESAGVTLKASGSGRCRLTFRATMRSCTTATGRWTDGSGHGGPLTLSRRGGAALPTAADGSAD